MASFVPYVGTVCIGVRLSVFHSVCRDRMFRSRAGRFSFRL